MPTSEALQVFYGTVPLVAAILLTNSNNNKRIDDLTTTVNTGFSDVKTSVNMLQTRVSDLEIVSRLIAG